jgi:hypothetical protein
MTKPTTARARRWTPTGWNPAASGLSSELVPSRTAAGSSSQRFLRAAVSGAVGWLLFTFVDAMGQAKARKQRLGSLYGTPEGSNSYIAPYFDPDKVKLLKKDSAAKYYISLHPSKAKQLRIYVAMMHIDLLGEKFRNELITLPDDFVEAFVRLLGHVIVPARQFEDWHQIAVDLRTITAGPKNLQALATWPFAANEPVSSGKCDPRHACYALLQKLTNMDPAQKGANFDENMQACWCLKHHKYIIFNTIPDHLVSVSCIQGGYLMHQSGSLYLFDQSCGLVLENDEPLWLTRLRPDGIFALGPMAQCEPLKPSEVKGMLQYVRSYVGPRLVGKLNPGREADAARLCKAVGLSVEGHRAWIGE